MGIQETPRRWFRFRLRTLLIMVTLLSVPLGWVGWELEQRRREKDVVAWVKEMGGRVYFSEFLDVRSWREKTEDNWFGEKVQIADLQNTQVSDLSPLSELKNLQWLTLRGTEVGDLSPLAELKKLKILSLENTPVRELSPLSELKNLQLLDLNHTQVSDLSPLVELKNLEALYLDDTQVTTEQVEELKLALPNCNIEF